jgi:aryl-alcohol dehydrogenase-like predicted oxidoreductase
LSEDLKSLRRLGDSDLMVSPVGLGCWQFSKSRGLSGSYWAALDDGEIERILAAALAGGINWFDTAEVYGRGESEKALAKGLRALGNLSPFPIDLYQVHNPLSVSSIAAQMKALAVLVEAGKVRAVGVSNFSRRQMEKAHGALRELGLPLVSNQVRYSLLDRRIETNGILAAAKDLGISIIAYSPLAQGLLSGKFHDDPRLARKHGGFRRFMPAFRPGGLAKSRAVVEALHRIASKYGATPSQVAINWLIGSPGQTVVAIPGASRAAQVEDFAAAKAFALTDEGRDELDRVSAPFK